jgi:hypothetical protein
MRLCSMATHPNTVFTHLCYQSMSLMHSADWVVNSGNIMNTNTSGGELALLLTQDNGGTRVSSTRYVHYGTITATSMLSFYRHRVLRLLTCVSVKASKWAGVVTAFITMSGVKDEVSRMLPQHSRLRSSHTYRQD